MYLVLYKLYDFKHTMNNIHFQTSAWSMPFMDKYWVWGSWDMEIQGAEPSDSAMYRCGRTGPEGFETWQLVEVVVYGIQ